MRHLALVLVLLASVGLLAPAARADELRVPSDMMLCHTPAAALSKRHDSCWRARGGQRVEIIAMLPTCAELRIWSTNGAESEIVYARRQDADRLQVPR